MVLVSAQAFKLDVRVIPVLRLCYVVVGTYYTTMYMRQQQTSKIREMSRFVSCEPCRTHYTTCKVHVTNQNTYNGSIHLEFHMYVIRAPHPNA